MTAQSSRRERSGESHLKGYTRRPDYAREYDAAQAEAMKPENWPPPEVAARQHEHDVSEGAQVLVAVRALFVRFVQFSNAHQAVAIALWVLHTWLFEAAETTPRLALQSPERESGKTRTLEVLDLVVKAPMQALDATPSALFRSIANGSVTFLVDEVDTVFRGGNGDDPKKGDVKAILNAGYRSGAVVPRTDARAKQVDKCKVFAPVALAGIGTLPDTVQSRSIVIPLKRRKASEPIERFRRRRVTVEAEALCKRIEGWATTDLVERLKDADPDIPDELGDRMQDCWEPLLAIADAAGGWWPQWARDAAMALSGRPTEASDDTITVRLLSDVRDVRDVFGERKRVASKVLAERLAEINDSPWGDWYGKPLTAHALARLLRDHAKPRKQRDEKGTFRGYFLADFEDAWARYLPPLDADDGTPKQAEQEEQAEQPTSGATCDVPLVPDVPISEGSPQTCPVCGDEFTSDGWCSCTF